MNDSCSYSNHSNAGVKSFGWPTRDANGERGTFSRKFLNDAALFTHTLHLDFKLQLGNPDCKTWQTNRHFLDHVTVLVLTLRCERKSSASHE
jgi:hypothetical protein